MALKSSPSSFQLSLGWQTPLPFLQQMSHTHRTRTLCWLIHPSPLTNEQTFIHMDGCRFMQSYAKNILEGGVGVLLLLTITITIRMVSQVLYFSFFEGLVVQHYSRTDSTGEKLNFGPLWPLSFTSFVINRSSFIEKALCISCTFTSHTMCTYI